MSRTQVDARIVIQAPIERVFARLADHEAMAGWPGITACRLVVEGQPRNGLGAVRRITAGGVTLDERVVRWDPPHGYDYQIIRGLPVEHLGTVTLSETADGVAVDWHIDMASRVPLLARFVGFRLRGGLPRALRYVAGAMAQEPAATV